MRASRLLGGCTAGLLALAVALHAGASEVAPPQRPTMEERLRLIQAHPRPAPDVGAALPKSMPGQDDVDVVNYELTLVPSPWQAFVEGTVTVTFVPVAGVAEVPELALDLASNMVVTPDGVSRRSAPGVAVPFTHDADILRIDLASGGGPVLPGQSEAVTIHYTGFPQQAGGGGLQFSVFGRFPNHVPSIYSLSEPFLARTWWPCKDRPDDKATITIRLDVPQDWEAVANGSLFSVTPSTRDGNLVTVWRERNPIATYLVSVYVSDYETCESTYVSPLSASVTTPVTVWAWPSMLAQACDRWSLTPAMMREFALRFGEYPFASEKYANVAVQPLPRTNPYVAMENQTCSAIGAGWLPLDHQTLIAHELAHQWWGNSVTPQDFRSIWLNEGFATYAEAQWWESQYGRAEYLGYMRDLDQLRATGEFVGPVQDPIDADGDGWPDGDGSGPELTVYYKGAWVLHMLRWVVAQPSLEGTSLRFDRILQQWASSFAQRNATTGDFTAMADRIATDQYGMRDGLLWFFDEWLTRDDRPCYRVGWTAAQTPSGWRVQVVVDQAKWGLDEDLGVNTCADPLPAPYRMPVAVRIAFADGSAANYVVDNREPSQGYVFDVAAQPVGVAWDPDGWILKGLAEVNVDGDGDSWADMFDDCPAVPDPLQADGDANGAGDACEDGLDFDGDGIPNASDCAPANPEVWTSPDALAPIEFRVHKGPNGLVVNHGMFAQNAGEPPYVLDLAQGRLERLAYNGSFRDATCVEPAATLAGEVTIPWAELPGNRYVVALPWNGCGPVDGRGMPDDPCR